MYIDILYTRNHQDMEDIPSYILSDTQYIYNCIFFNQESRAQGTY